MIIICYIKCKIIRETEFLISDRYWGDVIDQLKNLQPIDLDSKLE